MAYPKSPAIALWNPVWTVIWSYIFTPVFGAFLQRTNWSEMGERDRQQQHVDGSRVSLHVRLSHSGTLASRIQL